MDQVPVEQQLELGYLRKDPDPEAVREAESWLDQEYPLSPFEGTMKIDDELDHHTSAIAARKQETNNKALSIKNTRT
jgi:hypothetical protein